MSESALETTPVPAVDTEGLGFPGPEPAEDPIEAAKRETLKKWLDAETAWKTAFDADWPHQRVEFHGDYLAVRTPKQGALLAVTLAGAKYGSADGGLGHINRFLHLHLGPESHVRVEDRMMDPDETSYSSHPLNDLFHALSELIDV